MFNQLLQNFLRPIVEPVEAAVSYSSFKREAQAGISMHVVSDTVIKAVLQVGVAL